KIFRRLERKIRRAIELMASQVLQTAELTLIDNTGASLYTLDFQGKATHFPTVSVSWSAGKAGGAVPLLDVANLAQVVRRDGKRRPMQLVFGKTAWQHWSANEDVRGAFDVRRMELGEVAPQ